MTIKEMTIGQTIFVVQGFKVRKYKVHTIEMHKEKQLRVVSLFEPLEGCDTEKSCVNMCSTRMIVKPRYGRDLLGFISEEKASKEALKQSAKEYLRLKERAMACTIEANEFFENFINQIHVKPD